MSRSFARMCSVCKEEHALIASPNIPDGNVCICDRCLETVAKDNIVWICLCCREVYLESKRLLIEREADPAALRVYRDFMSECVVQGLETCLNCSGEAVFSGFVQEAVFPCC